MAKTLILLLGDQLTPDIASLAGADPRASILLMAEVAAEARYVKHHKRKIALIFGAMRHFAEERRAEGWTVDYVALDAPGNSGSLRGEVARALARHRIDRIVLVEPGERRLMEDVAGWQAAFGVPVDVMADDRFLCSRDAFAQWLRGQRQPRMEFFYRRMRSVTGLLMDGDAPAGGRWNFDAENRKSAPAGARWPQPLLFPPDGLTAQVLELVAVRFADHFGSLDAFDLPVTRAQALAALDAFIETALPRFGDYQDAMVDGEPLLAHSRLSAAINLGLLRPFEVCRAAEAAWRDGAVPINAAEGFIRQILGWREYVRGLYWAAPQLAEDANFLGADRALPEFYWTGETPMRCLAQAVAQTRELAYAHHIQRLMVLGNFALLAGVRPREVHHWFLVVYADAYEWVELPNVIGMSQFADGGLLASKPYAASGAYVDRMSDHCRLCRYDVKAKGGPDACPFNYLYWDFLARNRARLARNPRLRNAYATYDRLPDDRRGAIAADARAFLDALEPARPGWAV